MNSNLTKEVIKIGLYFIILVFFPNLGKILLRYYLNMKDFSFTKKIDN